MGELKAAFRTKFCPFGLGSALRAFQLMFAFNILFFTFSDTFQHSIFRGPINLPLGTGGFHLCLDIGCAIKAESFVAVPADVTDMWKWFLAFSMDSRKALSWAFPQADSATPSRASAAAPPITPPKRLLALLSHPDT